MRMTEDKSLYCTNHSVSGTHSETWPKELIQGLCTKRGLEYKDGYENRVVERTVAEDGVDWAGRRIVLDGGQYDEYVKKPQVLWMHDEEKFLGYSLRERIDGGVLKSLVLFLPTEGPFQETCFRMVKIGATKASSICIKPMEIEQVGEETVIKRWRLVAVSICSLWVTTEEFGDIYYNSLITKERIGEVNGLWFAIFSNETGLEPPHFHVMEGKKTKLASVNIETGEIFEGKNKLTARQRSLAKAFFDENQGHARERWKATRPG